MPKYNQPRKTWRYPNDFKVKAVQLSLLGGVQVQVVAQTLDIHPFMLSRWRKAYREGKLVVVKGPYKDRIEINILERNTSWKIQNGIPYLPFEIKLKSVGAFLSAAIVLILNPNNALFNNAKEPI